VIAYYALIILIMMSLDKVDANHVVHMPHHLKVRQLVHVMEPTELSLH
jgi:hypothetical protein